MSESGWGREICQTCTHTHTHTLYLLMMCSPSEMGWSVVEVGVAEEVGVVSVELMDRLNL